MARGEAIVLLCLLAVCSASQPSLQVYDVHKQLLEALQNNTYAKYSLSELFFPRNGSSPVCVPISYNLTCENEAEYNASYLWTMYDTESFAGKMLLSSAYFGFTLWGFNNWQKQCSFDHLDRTEVSLVIGGIDCNETEAVLLSELQALTAALKGYVSQSDVTTVTGPTITTYRAYAIQWSSTDDFAFRAGLTVLIILVAVLNLFIFFLSLGTSESVYDTVFKSIRHKRNPYYPIFWSVVVLSVGWNIWPGWAVLTVNVGSLHYFIPTIVLLQLFTALLMRKYLEFPIPGLRWKSPPHRFFKSKKPEPLPPRYFLWQICQTPQVARGVISFIVQTVTVWSLLVLFTLVVYYAVTIAVSLYLDPIQTLVKVLFVKAVAMCAMFAVALLFASNSLEWKCTQKSCYINFIVVTQFLSALTFLPVLAYLAYMIGGVIFVASSTQLSGIQGVLAILPSAFLIIIGWASHGQLFPEKMVETDSIQEVSKDVQEAASHSEDVDGDSMKSDANQHPGYGSMDVQQHSNGIDQDPLIPSSKAV